MLELGKQIEGYLMLGRMWLRFSKLKKWQKISIIVVLVGVLGNLISSDPSSTEISTDSKEVIVDQQEGNSSNFPKLTRAYDGYLEKVLRPFYDSTKDKDWWGRVIEIKEGSIGDESNKMIYVMTDYEMSNASDVENGTIFCNALIKSVPRVGLSVRVDGVMTSGQTLLDGTMKTLKKDEPITTFGSSTEPNKESDWCVARALFKDVKEGLLQRGWKQQYGYGELTEIEKEKMFEGSGSQTGNIWMVN